MKKPQNTVAKFNRVPVKRLCKVGTKRSVCHNREAVYMTKEAIEPIETGLSQYTYSKFALINETIDQSLVRYDH